MPSMQRQRWTWQYYKLTDMLHRYLLSPFNWYIRRARRNVPFGCSRTSNCLIVQLLHWNVCFPVFKYVLDVEYRFQVKTVAVNLNLLTVCLRSARQTDMRSCARIKWHIDSSALQGAWFRHEWHIFSVAFRNVISLPNYIRFKLYIIVCVFNKTRCTNYQNMSQ